jgi:class 3 adenylate cyclase
VTELSTRTGLRIFLSADLAGSTAFKQASEAEEWQKFFLQFYRQLPAYVEKRKTTFSYAAKLVLWKTVGDEIVFSMELTSHNEAPACVAAFRLAVAEYRREVVESFKSTDKRFQTGVDIKCAGWTAGFPVGNLVVQLPGNQIDYIGPGMDIGFRLVKEASPRRMLLSVELAFLLTLQSRTQTSPGIYIDGGMQLKGVAKGRPYPCLWLDNFRDKDFGGLSEIALAEEKVARRVVKPGNSKELHTFCRRWLVEMGEPFVVPFIDGDRVIGTRPPGYKDIWRRVTESTQASGESITRREPPREKGRATTTEDEMLQALKQSRRRRR